MQQRIWKGWRLILPCPIMTVRDSDSMNMRACTKGHSSLKPAANKAINRDPVSNYQLTNNINDAISNPKPLSETQPQCATGNCTWPLFKSVGFCYICKNISQPLRNGFTSVELPLNFTAYQECLESAPYENNATCSVPRRNYIYRLPELNGQILRTSTYGGDLSEFPRSFFKISEISKIPAFFVISLFGDWFAGKVAFNFTDGTSVPMPALIALIRTSPQDSDGSGNGIAADVCALSFCAQKRNVSVLLGQASFNILQTVYGAQHTLPHSDTADMGWLSFTGVDLSMIFNSHPMGRSPLTLYSHGRKACGCWYSLWRAIWLHLAKHFGASLGLIWSQILP